MASAERAVASESFAPLGVSCERVCWPCGCGRRPPGSGLAEHVTAGSIRIERDRRVDVVAGDADEHHVLVAERARERDVRRPAASQLAVSGSSAEPVNAPAYSTSAVAERVAVNVVPPTHAPEITGVPS